MDPELPPANHVLLVVGGVLLVTWYGMHRLREWRPRDEESSGERFSRPMPPAVATAFEAEFRPARPGADFLLPGGESICPNCGITYPAGILYCDCGSELVEEEDLEEPAAPIHEETDRVSFDLGSEELVCVHVAETVWKAGLIKSYLEHHDIPCATLGNSSSGPYAMNIGHLAEVRILVHAHHADQARVLVSECTL